MTKIATASQNSRAQNQRCRLSFSQSTPPLELSIFHSTISDLMTPTFSSSIRRKECSNNLGPHVQTQHENHDWPDPSWKYKIEGADHNSLASGLSFEGKATLDISPVRVSVSSYHEQASSVVEKCTSCPEKFSAQLLTSGGGRTS
ncbi:hypothetical protein KM043_005687 [Ampulex compressa]|nr:hypothetical protein KM043_005687 [Ampulex compressa]